MTVAELELRMSSREFTEWMAYRELTGPLGRRRQDVNAALVASTVARAAGGRSRTLDDFLIKYDAAGVAQPPAEMLQVMKSITLSLGGEVVEGEVVGDRA